MKKVSSLLLAVLLALPAFSQEAEMADGLRADGKIYALVAILLVILVGLVAYLITIDRKASRLERKLEETGRT